MYVDLIINCDGTIFLIYINVARFCIPAVFATFPRHENNHYAHRCQPEWTLSCTKQCVRKHYV